MFCQPSNLAKLMLIVAILLINIIGSMGRKSDTFLAELLIDRSQFSLAPVELDEIVLKVKFLNEDSGASRIYVPVNADDELSNNDTNFRDLEKFEFHMLQETIGLVFNLVKYEAKNKETNYVNKITQTTGELSSDRIDVGIRNIWNEALGKTEVSPTDNSQHSSIQSTNAAITYFNNEDESFESTIKFDEMFSTASLTSRNMNFLSSSVDNTSSIVTNHENEDGVNIKESNSQVLSLDFPRSPVSPTAVKIVKVTSLEDTVTATANNCDDLFDISSRECNIRSAIEYCRVLSSVRCIIQLPCILKSYRDTAQ